LTLFAAAVEPCQWMGTSQASPSSMVVEIRLLTAGLKDLLIVILRIFDDAVPVCGYGQV